MAGFDLSILSSLLPAAGAGASGFMEGQQQAIAANQAKQAMYLAEQEERRRQTLFPKQVRAVDDTHAKFMQDFEHDDKMNPFELARAGLPVRPNVPGLNADVAKGLDVSDPNLLAQMTQPEQIDALAAAAAQKAGIVRAGTGKPSADPTKRLAHLERMYKQFSERPPKNVNEVIAVMDDDMRTAIRGTAASQTVEAALAYYASEIANERKRLGMSENNMAPKAKTMESIFNEYMPVMTPKK
jgi:hypothetical protein